MGGFQIKCLPVLLMALHIPTNIGLQSVGILYELLTSLLMLDVMKRILMEEMHLTKVSTVRTQWMACQIDL